MKITTFQKLLSIFICAALCIFVCVPVNAADDVATGSCGTALNWTLNSFGVLTISGTGAMDEWSAETNVPWFSQKESITAVIISEGVTSIGKHAFKGCTNLVEVEIAEGVTTIGYGAFQNCTALLSVDIPESVDSIRQSAFMGCSSLKKVDFPSTLTTFDWGVFSSCKNLKDVELPEGINRLPYAFAWCTGLERVVLPKSFTYGADGIFMGCTSLKTVIFTGDAPSFYYATFDGYYQFENVTATCYYPLGNETWNNFSKGGYGGNLTWVGYEGSHEEIGKTESNINISLNNVGAGASGAVVTEPESGWVEGTNTFTVTCAFPCVVAVSYDGGFSYARLTATTTNTENTYSFTAENLAADAVIAVAMIGDANSDGSVTSADITRLRACYAGKITLDALQKFTADVNGRGDITSADITKLRAVYAGKTTMSW